MSQGGKRGLPVTDDPVRQTSHDYFELKGFMRFMGGLTKGMFKKQSLKYMTAFKDYVERESS